MRSIPTGNGAFWRSPQLGTSGTDNDLDPSYPSNYFLPNIIAVAATDRNDGIASFSQFGSTSVHIGAPGVDIRSTTRNDTYQSVEEWDVDGHTACRRG